MKIFQINSFTNYLIFIYKLFTNMNWIILFIDEKTQISLILV